MACPGPGASETENARSSIRLPQTDQIPAVLSLHPFGEVAEHRPRPCFPASLLAFALILQDSCSAQSLNLGMSNVVDVHVNSLRNKIDKGFPAPLIHTIRGVGYMLAAEIP